MVMITKRSGEQEPFSETKYRTSLRRADVDKKFITLLVAQIKPVLYDGISTKELYKKTSTLLEKLDRSCAGRYSLKHALRALGPSGFPFEHLIARLFEHQGFTVKVGQTIKGKCITHEVDVIAYNKKICHLVECKFHLDAGERMSVQVPMYVKSRFEDILQATKKPSVISTHEKVNYWVATNAKLSTQSKEFAQCVGMKLLAWRYPDKNSLAELIKKYELYPITTLTTLKKIDRIALLTKGIVLCKDIGTQHKELKKMGFSQQKIAALIEDCKNICSYK